jgi:cysteine synthase
MLEQARGSIGAFVAGVGTGGTITGVGRFLKSRLPGIRVVMADPVGSSLADWIETGTLGPDGKYQVEGIGGSRPPEIFDRTVVDEVQRISDDESFAMARRLWREEGLLVGGSAGTAVAAALRVAASGKASAPIIALLPDAWDRYRSQPWMQPAPEPFTPSRAR